MIDASDSELALPETHGHAGPDDGLDPDWPGVYRKLAGSQKHVYVPTDRTHDWALW
jgi:hypothetical protein